MHRTNIRGTFVVGQQAARRVRPGGAIVNFSTSVVGLQFPEYGGYAASKGAVEAMTLMLAREMRGRDVSVNAVAPGPTATELFLDGKDQATIDRLAKQPPLERLGTPEDIAASWPSWRPRQGTGSTARCSGPTAGSSEAVLALAAAGN